MSRKKASPTVVGAARRRALTGRSAGPSALLPLSAVAGLPAGFPAGALAKAESFASDGISGSRWANSSSNTALDEASRSSRRPKGQAVCRLPGTRKISGFWKKTIGQGRDVDALCHLALTDLTLNYRIVSIFCGRTSTDGQPSPDEPDSSVSDSISHWCISSPTSHMRV